MKLQLDTNQTFQIDAIAAASNLFNGQPKGSAAGHHGIESIIASLGSQESPRLRVGIGRPGDTGGTIDYVLDDFLPSERDLVEEVIARVSKAIDSFVSEGLEMAMSKFNRDETPS